MELVDRMVTDLRELESDLEGREHERDIKDVQDSLKAGFGELQRELDRHGRAQPEEQIEEEESADVA